MNRNEQKELVSRAQAGDRSAFEALYNENMERVYAFAKRNLGSDDAARDVTAETFASALEHIGELRSGESFIGWLYSIAYSKCADRLRENSRTEYFETDSELEKAMQDQALNEPIMLPDDYAVNAETKRLLGEIIDSLSPDQRSAVILYYYDELSIPEVAKALGTNENNTRQKLHKARGRIRKQVEKLIGKGAVFAAVPLGAVLNNTADASYARAAVSGAARVKSVGLGVKIAAIGAAATVAVGVPLGLRSLGDYRPETKTVCFGRGGNYVCPQGIVSSQSSIIRFTDFENGETIPLCSKPDCKHYDESCNAYYNEPVFEVVYNGSLYVLDNGKELNKSTLYKAENDGSSRKAIAELECDGSLTEAYVIDSGKLFCFTSNTDSITNDMSFCPTIIDFDSGEIKRGEATQNSSRRLLYANSTYMYYSKLKTKFDMNSYLLEGREEELDALINDPKMLDYSLYRFDGDKTELIDGFDSSNQAIYFDDNNSIVYDVSDNSYRLADTNGEAIKELIVSPNSAALYMYNTVAFIDSSNKVQYYDIEKQELIGTDASEIPMYIYGSKVVFSAESFALISDWAEVRTENEQKYEGLVLDDEYFREHWPDKALLHIYSDISVCDAVNAAFNDRLVELGKNYVVDFEQARECDTSEEYISALTKKIRSGEPIDIFCTGSLAEGESSEPYSLCIKNGLCEPFAGHITLESEFYKAYSETMWKCVTHGKGIYGYSGRKNLSAGLAFDADVKEPHQSEIEKLSDIKDLLIKISGEKPGMLLNNTIAEYIKNQNGILIGGCIPVRLNNEKKEAFNPYTTDFFKDFVQLLYEGNDEGFVGNDLFAPIRVSTRLPKMTDEIPSQITVKGMEDYAGDIETDVWCVSACSEYKDYCFDLFTELSRDESLNNLLYYGIKNVSYEVSGSIVVIKDNDKVFGSQNTIGNELLLIENKSKAKLYQRYNDSLPTITLNGIELKRYEDSFAEYREIIAKYSTLLDGDVDYSSKLKKLISELDSAGYEITIQELNTMFEQDRR